VGEVYRRYLVPVTHLIHCKPKLSIRGVPTPSGYGAALIAAGVYFLCALTASLCAALLTLAWRRTRLPILFWSGLCFAGLTLSNAILIVDRIVVPGVDLFVWRNLTALVSAALLLCGLMWKMD
jgi:hypothetical protein